METLLMSLEERLKIDSELEKLNMEQDIYEDDEPPAAQPFCYEDFWARTARGPDGHEMGWDGTQGNRNMWPSGSGQ